MHINRIKERDYLGELLRRIGILTDPTKTPKLSHKPKLKGEKKYYLIDPHESEHTKGI